MFGFKRKEKETVTQYTRSLTQKNPSLTDWLGSNLGEVPVSFKNREVLLDNVLITQSGTIKGEGSTVFAVRRKTLGFVVDGQCDIVFKDMVFSVHPDGAVAVATTPKFQGTISFVNCKFEIGVAPGYDLSQFVWTPLIVVQNAHHVLLDNVTIPSSIEIQSENVTIRNVSFGTLSSDYQPSYVLGFNSISTQGLIATNTVFKSPFIESSTPIRTQGLLRFENSELSLAGLYLEPLNSVRPKGLPSEPIYFAIFDGCVGVINDLKVGRLSERTFPTYKRLELVNSSNIEVLVYNGSALSSSDDNVSSDSELKGI